MQPVFGEEGVIKLQNNKLLLESTLPFGDVIYILYTQTLACRSCSGPLG